MKTKKQYAALPYIVFETHIEVLLITRRRSKRWIIPKGWPEADLLPHKLAELEAFEEAGLRGQIGKKSLGRFSYVKQLNDNESVLCDVEVFPLEVSAQYLDWPEKSQRDLSWLKPDKATALLEEEDLVSLILNFSPTKKRSKGNSPAKARSKDKSKKRSKGKSRNKSRLTGKISATL